MEKKNFVFTTEDKKELINIINIVNILKENGEENISEIKNNVRDDFYVFYNGYVFIISIGKSVILSHNIFIIIYKSSKYFD